MGDFYHSNDSASTDYSHKIEELENSKQFQDAIGLIREQMKNNLKWNVLRSFGIICAILFSFYCVCSYSFDPFSCWFVLLATI